MEKVRKSAKAVRRHKKEREKFTRPKEMAGTLKRFAEFARNEAGILVDIHDDNPLNICDQFMEVIEPILSQVSYVDDIREVVKMGIYGWNCGIIKMTRGEQKLEEMMKTLDCLKNPGYRQLLEEFIDYKCTKYPKITNYIASYELKFDGSYMDLDLLTGITKEMEKFLNR